MRTLTNGQVARIFEDAAESYDARSNPYTMRRRADALAARTEGITIEVGGGTAAVLQAMPDRSRSFHSDIAFPMCRVARSKVHRPSACFDAEQIPLADSSVDTVVSAEMIYYLRRPQRLVSEAFRILRPGGNLILSTTNPIMTLLERGRSVLRKMGLPGMFFDDGSPKFPSLTRLCALLSEAGFRVESMQGIVPLPFRFCHLLNCLLERTAWNRLGLFLIIAARKPSLSPYQRGTQEELTSLPTSWPHPSIE
jgi:ubiquinone/menaquinone biosynthesis C-methylase UbiE